jgi:hypothetical protein
MPTRSEHLGQPPAIPVNLPGSLALPGLTGEVRLISTLRNSQSKSDRAAFLPDFADSNHDCRGTPMRSGDSRLRNIDG